MAKLIDREEITACVNSLLVRLKIKQEAVETALNVGKGVNYMGEIKSLRVKGRDHADKPVELRLILKIAPSHLPTRSFLTVDRAYQCEIFIYQTTFPLFINMQSEANVVNRFESFPKYFTSSNKYLHEVLILEDMVQFTVKNKLSTLDKNEAFILVTEIGKLHAMSFILRKKNPKLLQEISTKIRNEKRDHDEYCKLVCAALIKWAPRILNLLDCENTKKAYEKFRNFSISVNEFLDRQYSFSSDDEHGVIGHCDLWASNLMFDDQASSSKVCILDWQTARVCSPAVDLSEILFVCCDQRMRNEHGQDLIDAYYNSCSLHIRQFGEDSDVLFPYSVLKRHLKVYSGYSLCIAIRTISMMSVPMSNIPDVSSAQNYLDVANMYGSAKIEPELFNERIKSVLLDYVDYGYDI